MFALAVTNLIALCVLSLIHVVMAWLFYRYLTRTTHIALPDDFAPKAVVVLCLRGPDPFLRKTLLSLTKQDYPNYSVKVVIDSRDDPTWKIVEDVASQSERIDFEFAELSNRPKNCSLKCASIVQAVQSTDEDAEVIVLSDADVVPYESWLRELVAPLSNSDVGVATGNQWFDPTYGHIGSLVRNVWHAGAIIPTLVYRNPWAGSCAMRLSDIRDSGLLEKWSTTIVDDGPINLVYREMRKKVHVVPSVMIVNREECNLKFCFTYIRRMLTWSRIYEKTFLLTPIHMLVMVSSLQVAIGLILRGFFVGPAMYGWMGVCGIGAFAFSLLVAYLLVDAGVVTVVNARKERLERTGPLRLLKMACYFPIAIIIYASVLLPAAFAKRVRWRGITYKVNGPWDVELIDDVPYVDASDKHRVASV